MEFSHIPVLRDETINSLNINPDGIYVDGTLGGAGHSMEILKRLSPKGQLICFDQDIEAIESSSKKLNDTDPEQFSYTVTLNICLRNSVNTV